MSKNSRLGKAGLEHDQPKDSEVNAGIIIPIPEMRVIKLENPHLFVTLPQAEAVYIKLSSAVSAPLGALFPCAVGNH